MPDPTHPASDLEREGALLARYLLGRRSAGASEVSAARYADACRRLFTEPAPPRDIALMRFACRHPLALPCLDAAAGLLLPRTLLRQKLILMLAILETMPELAESFLPAAKPPLRVMAGLARTGAAVAFKTLGGVVLLPLAWRSR